MAKAKAGGKAQNRRGSPEAIEKRRAARIFNDVLGGRGPASQRLDGRTEKRRQRLLKELGEGVARGSRELKPLDILQRVQELMDLGEPLSAIRKAAKVARPKFDSLTPGGERAGAALVDVVGRLHKAYNFRPEAYRFVGIGDDVLRVAGVLTADVLTEKPARAKGRARASFAASTPERVRARVRKKPVSPRA